MKNSKGFTLVELIITVSIIAIASSLMFASLTQTTSMSVDESANKISSLLSYTRVATLSGKIEPYLEISAVDGEFYGTVYAKDAQTDAYEQIHSENIGDKSVKLSHENEAGAITPIVEGENYRISYSLGGAVENPENHKSIMVIAGYETVSIEITASTGYHEIV